jgi:hypothetical protein
MGHDDRTIDGVLQSDGTTHRIGITVLNALKRRGAKALVHATPLMNDTELADRVARLLLDECDTVERSNAHQFFLSHMSHERRMEIAGRCSQAELQNIISQGLPPHLFSVIIQHVTDEPYITELATRNSYGEATIPAIGRMRDVSLLLEIVKLAVKFEACCAAAMRLIDVSVADAFEVAVDHQITIERKVLRCGMHMALNTTSMSFLEMLADYGQDDTDAVRPHKSIRRLANQRLKNWATDQLNPCPPRPGE